MENRTETITKSEEQSGGVQHWNNWSFRMREEKMEIFPKLKEKGFQSERNHQVPSTIHKNRYSQVFHREISEH